MQVFPKYTDVPVCNNLSLIVYYTGWNPAMEFYLRDFNDLATYFPREKWLCHTYNATNTYNYP